MPEGLQPWIGDIHKVVGPMSAGVMVTLASVLCGALIGAERQRAQKPAGLRTLVLICLGSAVFTQASLLLAQEHADRTRIAAQIVSGIGFLGAGAIIRERGMIIGVTTGASIWATAAVGMVVGGGYIAAGIFFSLLILGTLGAARVIDRVAEGPCNFRDLRVEYTEEGGKTRLALQALLDRHQHPEPIRFESPGDGAGVAHIRYCSAHRDHRQFLEELADMPPVRRVSME